ncbi:hypothetical protein KIW84_060148 [Lathyrus oleraceus]|uniref:Pentatricopeptide repeat-containing protein n=1 Tax=Pisum sativum TaxID=3888 RepID=A0A9D5A0K3_PEA|nr:hypothetical protein KIW84_060148 [Pisum sativum]
MQEKRCEPDHVTYCTLIDIHAKAGFLDVAMSMYERMQQVGLSPDTFTYSGCVPNIVTYNIMIALQAKARNYETTLKLYRDMQNAGFKPDKVTYNIVMEVLGHCGYLEEVEAVFVEMKQRNTVKWLLIFIEKIVQHHLLKKQQIGGSWVLYVKQRKITIESYRKPNAVQ